MIYSISYISEKLWFTTASTLLFSMPIQLFSFFHWKTHKSGKASAELQVLSAKQQCLTVLLTLAGWAICYFWMLPLLGEASVPSLDTLSFATGTTCTILVAFRFVDSQYYNLINCLAQIVIWVILTIHNPGNFNYIIISCYGFFRTAEAAFLWTRQYIRAKKETECITI